MVDRRINDRISLPLEVHIESLSGRHAARLSDVSLGGCYVESLAPVTIGERIHFGIQLPTGRWLPLNGEVVYYHPNLGFGVRFTNLSGVERKMLAYIIEYGKQS